MLPRLSALAILLLPFASPIIPSTVGADEAENYQRLQAMPRERRVALAENLDRFDKLDPVERAAIRKLDAAIAAKDPVEQARYRAALRRYHLWVSGLSDEQKQSLKAAETPDARFALARKLRTREAQALGSGPRVSGIRTGEFGLIGPYEAAHMLKVWNRLDPARKAEIEKQRERGRLFDAIRAEAKSANVRFEQFPPAEEAVYTARIEADEAFKKMLGPMMKWPDPAAKKGDSPAKKAESPQRRFEHPFAEFLYFEDHKPRAVAPRDLERFAMACPPWLHAMTDPLSPDDETAYLTILYRLLYPHPAEMPPDAKPAKAAGSLPTSPRATPRKSSNPGPF